MSEYKGIKGFQVQTRTEDPAPFAQALADNPYAGSWASGGTMNTARRHLGGGSVGTQTAGLTAGGYLSTSPGSGALANSEEYDGSSWTEGNDLNGARYDSARFGTQTASYVAGGEGYPVPSPGVTAIVENYNGTSWTETTDLPTTRRTSSGAGTATAGLVFAGQLSGAAPLTDTSLEWDGSSWTAGGTMNTARKYLTGYGIQTYAHAAGGYTTTDVAIVEQYNGTAWTEIADLNTARQQLSGTGTYTSSLVFGGSAPPATAKTESWDNSSWTEVADLSTAVKWHGSGGSNNTSALSFGGSPGSGRTGATEEWAFSGVQPTDAASYANAITGDFYYNSTTGQFKTVNDGGVPIGTWASGGTLPRETYNSAATGTVSATLLWSGYDDSAYFNDSLEFNGSTWGSPVNMNVPATGGRFGVGTQTASLAISGYNPSPAPGIGMPQVESYNGSAWSEIADVNTGISGHGVAGNTSNAIKYAGTTAMVSPSHPTKSYEATTEQYNGSSWTEVADLNTAREGVCFANQMPYTAGVAVGGSNAPGAVLAIHEIWNGSAWTETGDLNTARSNGGGASDGTQTSIIVYGGNNPAPGYLANNEFWNGTSWTEVNDLSAGRYGLGATGASSTNAMAIGNYPSESNANTWEHFVAGDFSIKTVTTS
jgi:hypothetical protein